MICRRLALAAAAVLVPVLPGGATAQVTGGPALTLEEAVATTLQSSYEVRQAAAEVEGRRGAWLEASGIFDPSLFSDLEYVFEQEQMLRGEITQEIRRRVPLEFLALGTPDNPNVGALDQAARALLDRDRLEGSLFVDDCELDLRSPTIVDVDLENTDIEGTTLQLCLDADGVLRGIALDSVAIGSEDLARLDAILDLLAALNDLDVDLPDVDRDEIESFIRAISDNLARLAEVLREQRANLGGLPEEVERMNLTWESGARWLLRNGLQVSAILALRGNDEDFDGKPRAAEFGGSPVAAIYSTTAGLRLIVPLGKGRGRVATVNPELATEAAYEAQRALYFHTASEEALRAIRAYWAAAAARERLELRLESARLQEEILETTGHLIEAEELPGAERHRADARAAEVRRQVDEARRQLVEARLELVRTMGSTVSDLDGTPTTSSGIPQASTLPIAPGSWIETARERRFDLAAARETSRSAELLAAKAKADLRRQVDLTLSLSYNGILERGPTRQLEGTPEEIRAQVAERYEDRIYDIGRYWDAASGHIAGPSFTIGLRWTLPFGNRTARGRLIQAQAARVTSEVLEMDLERKIELRLWELGGVLERLRDALADLQDALAGLEASLEASRELFAIGDIPLIDLLTTEQQVVDTRVAIIDLRSEIASLEGDIRFESGMLLREPRPEEQVGPGHLNLVTHGDRLARRR